MLLLSLDIINGFVGVLIVQNSIINYKGFAQFSCISASLPLTVVQRLKSYLFGMFAFKSQLIHLFTF